MLLAKTGKPKRKGKSPFCLLPFSLWQVTFSFSLRCCSSSSSTLLWSHVSHFAVSVTIDSTYWQPHISVNICRIMWFWLISAQQGKSWKRPHYSTLSMSVGWWPGCWANKFDQQLLGNYHHYIMMCPRVRVDSTICQCQKKPYIKADYGKDLTIAPCSCLIPCWTNLMPTLSSFSAKIWRTSQSVDPSCCPLSMHSSKFR